MEPVFVREYTIDDNFVDRFGRMRPSAFLFVAQEMGCEHSALMDFDYDTLAARQMFWAVTRHSVQITRIPMIGEKIRVETWPMPVNKAAFPRSVVAYDEAGNECFRSITLWVLMNLRTRRMVLPKQSGIVFEGLVRGGELAVPGGLIPRPAACTAERTVRFSDLDRNGHMNNTRCMEWIADLLPGEFHRDHRVNSILVCYQNEAREGETLAMNPVFLEDGSLQVDACCGVGEDAHRVFSARLSYE